MKNSGDPKIIKAVFGVKTIIAKTTITKTKFTKTVNGL
ncbi:hypothetical protein MNBD_ALPHA11-144 [hydrothermal vent metagenome]|uniref:Uncharacterized protein n=1 Tax=hydrothermal vent metagenome TaxID=652676 RepID=A0A3B0ULD7_9ZZZZ